jgi:hypothetical protein
MTNTAAPSWAERHNHAGELLQAGDFEAGAEQAWLAATDHELNQPGVDLRWDVIGRCGRFIAVASALQLQAAPKPDDLDGDSYTLKLQRAELLLTRAIEGGVSVLVPAEEVLAEVRQAARKWADFKAMDDLFAGSTAETASQGPAPKRRRWFR